MIFENGKYYVWCTYRNTPVKPVEMARVKEANDTILSSDCDLHQDIHDDDMKGHYIRFSPEFHYQHRLNKNNWNGSKWKIENCKGNDFMMKDSSDDAGSRFKEQSSHRNQLWIINLFP